jgi:glycosyltransferase involved in cell wall biosynthesis
MYKLQVHCDSDESAYLAASNYNPNRPTTGFRGALLLKIAFDPWVLSSRFKYHGTQVYALNLLAEFRKMIPSQTVAQICLFSSGQAEGFEEMGATPGFEVVDAPLLRFDRLWRIAGLGRAAAGAGADLIFSPTTHVLPVGTVPVVCTIHDLTPIKEPSHDAKVNTVLKTFMWTAARRSRTVITVSECSRRDLIDHYRLPPERVRVVYNGFDRAIFNPAPPDGKKLGEIQAAHGITAPYIAHHGTLQPRKNMVRLIHAYDLLLQRRPQLDLQLVLMGPPGWQYEEIMRAGSSQRSRGKVVFTGALSDADLALLLKGSLLAVMPSLYEGFCLPMVEAMACGIPTVAASTSCLPEVSGNALRYFDPLSIEDIAGCMEAAIFDTSLRRRLREDGIQRAVEFSWERCARETLKVLIEAGTNSER